MDALPDSTWFASVRRRVLAWYRKHGRDLPWRGTQDPYKIWISEVMLQQTQVETVRPYYHKFLKQFPTIKRLAGAPEREVLRMWEGLGYYRRARQLHAAAQRITQAHRGKFPTTFDEVLALPGIGRYTAGAILSFADDQRHPILEGNTVRLHARLLAYHGDVTRSAGQRLLWECAERLLPRQKCGELNQALMEVGGQVCRSKRPLCLQCPLSAMCSAFTRGVQLELPNTGARVEYESIAEAAVVLRRGNRILLRECQEGERWAGLWDFPRYAVSTSQGAGLRRELTQKLKDSFGLDVTVGTQLLKMKHGVTKYRITLHCFTGECSNSRRALPKFAKWVECSELPRYPLSVTGRKISERLVIPIEK